jgi:hypothetical protein
MTASDVAFPLPHHSTSCINSAIAFRVVMLLGLSVPRRDDWHSRP